MVAIDPLTTTVSDEMKASVHRAIIQVFGEGNLAALDELLAPECVIHTADYAEPDRDVEGMKEFVLALRQGFPDLSVEVVGLVAEGDTVMAHWIFSGTHRGELQGLPATGRQVEQPVMDRFRIVDGKIADFWVITNQLGLLQALGVFPAGGAPPRPLIWMLKLRQLFRRGSGGRR